MFEFLKKFLAADKPVPPAPKPKPPAQATDPDEALLASIRTYRKRMFKAAEREFASNQLNAEGDNQKIERAERFLEESGLGRGIAEFMTTIWSTRNQAEKASEAAPLPGEHGMQLTGGGRTGGGRTEKYNEWITFFYGNHHYRAENRPRDWSRR